MTPDLVVSTPSGITEAQTDKLATGATGVVDLINIISCLHFYIVTNTSTINTEVNHYI